jgi:hypothetical protein
MLIKLLKLIKIEKISLLFRNILNNLDFAKKTVLKALVDIHGKIKFTPTFDDIIKLRILCIDDD